MPFAQSESGDLFLLAPLPDISESDQRAALAHLVSLGVLSVYRYIDSKPQPAILAVRACPSDPRGALRGSQQQGCRRNPAAP